MTDPVPDGNTGVPEPAAPDPALTPAPDPAPAPVAPEAKIEIKDGRVVVDGKKFVPESDLMAIKESLTSKLTQAQTVHDAAIDAARLATSEAQKQVATLNAQIEENKEALTKGAVTEEAAAKINTDLESAKASIESLSASALELKRANIILQYGVTAETIKDKTI